MLRCVVEFLVLLSGTTRGVLAVARPQAAAPAGTTRAVLDSSNNSCNKDHISGQFLFYQDHHDLKAWETLYSMSCTTVLTFIPIGNYVTAHNDGTANDITSGK